MCPLNLLRRHLVVLTCLLVGGGLIYAGLPGSRLDPAEEAGRLRGGAPTCLNDPLVACDAKPTEACETDLCVASGFGSYYCPSGTYDWVQDHPQRRQCQLVDRGATTCVANSTTNGGIITCLSRQDCDPESPCLRTGTGRYCSSGSGGFIPYSQYYIPVKTGAALCGPIPVGQ